jgi:Putative metal-binding motif
VLDGDGLLTIEIEIEDRETPPELLELGWAGTLDMDETPDNPGREGRALFQVPAEPGSYDLTLAIIDEADQSTIIDYSFYVYSSDNDGDSYTSISYGGDDCDDYDAASYPGAEEVCDYRDNDCDGLVDGDDPGMLLSRWYADSDGDGYGDSALLSEGCEAPPGAVTDNTDCDDSAAAVYPWAPEICDGQNNNCWYAGSWTEDWEDGLAGWTAGDGTWSDATALLSGSSGAPALLTLTSGGRLRICGGLWYARIAVAATPVEIEGSGAVDTILHASGEADGLRIVLADASVTLRNLGLTGGAGCRPGISNHDGSCEAPIWYPGVSLSMEEAWVYDNEGDSATADDASGVILRGEPGRPVVWTMVDSAVYGNGVDHGPRLSAGSLRCSGQPISVQGFWGQQEGLRLEAGGTLDSQGCDWLGLQDNISDIVFPDGSAATGYGDDATFTCDGDLRSCTP